MNIFIYDSFLNQKKYDRLLARLETRITDLGLNGKISRLSLMRSVNETVTFELKRGAKTIIAVGGNGLINQIVNSLCGSPVPLAVIPVGEENNDIAAALGIRSLEDACDILSARLLARLDLGVANGKYFLGHAAITNQGTIVDMNKNFTVESAEQGVIKILNLAASKTPLPAGVSFDPQDGRLELVVDAESGKKVFSRAGGQSMFKVKKITVTNRKAPLILDGSLEIPTPAEVSVAAKCLNVIVGKNRKF